MNQVTSAAVPDRIVGWNVPGARPPVVCLPGAGVSSRALVPFVSALRGVRETWAVDYPGFGGTSRPREAPRLTELADWVERWLGDTIAEPVHLVGSSFGCQVVAEIAARFPWRVRSGILVGPTVDSEARGVSRQLARLARTSLNEPMELGWLNLRDYWDAGGRLVLAAFSEALRDRVEDKLPRVTVPTLVVRGERDAFVPQPWADEVTRLLPRGRLRVWPESAHMVAFSHPCGLAKLAESFWAEVGS